MKNSKQLKNLLSRLQDGSISEKEVRQLLKQSGALDDPDKKKEWLQAVKSLDQKQSARLIPPVQPDEDKQRFLNKLKEGTSQEKIAGASFSQTSRSRQSRPWLKVAAGIAIVAVAVSIYMLSLPEGSAPQLVVHETLQGQKSKITLPDGSTVQLNSGSRLTYEDFGTGTSTREVKIEGEAFFNVARDRNRPFVVHTATLKTTVLGTSFNVRSYAHESEVQVVVATGKVSVENPIAGMDSRVLMIPNEMVSYHTDEKTMTKSSGDFSDLLAWKDGRLIFYNVTIREAIPALERWYGVEIVLQNEKVGNCPIKVEIEGESLNTVFRWLNFSMGDGFEYEIKDKQVLISGNGC